MIFKGDVEFNNSKAWAMIAAQLTIQSTVGGYLTYLQCVSHTTNIPYYNHRDDNEIYESCCWYMCKRFKKGI